MLKQAIIIFLKGLLMGSADIVPGVSGGTMALVTRIYTRLVDGINHIYSLLNRQNLKYLYKGNFKKLKQEFLSIDFALFIPLGLGIVSAFLLLANLIHFLMHDYAIGTYAFFLGLILASAWFLYRQLKIHNRALIAIVIGFICGFVIVGLEGLKANHSLLIIFLSGAIAITAMILPGISGAFMLVLLNQYEYMLNVLRTLAFKEIITFIFGAVLGLALFSRLISYLLHKYRSLTMGFLIGLMLGSLRLQLSIIGQHLDAVTALIAIIYASAGFVLVAAVTRVTKES